MAGVTLPLTFQNSFWTEDYRTGLEVLYNQLEKGVAENEEIVTFIKARAAAETAIAATLTQQPEGTAFDTNEGASLPLAFRGLRDESYVQGQLHAEASKDLQTKIAEPFAEWAKGYKERLHASRGAIVDGYLRAYEHAHGEIAGLKNIYITKTHRADELEDDVRFAPITQPAGETYTSPSLRAVDKRQPRAPVRQQTVSERITARLREFRLNATSAVSSSPVQEGKSEGKPVIHFDADVEEKDAPGTPKQKVDKGKGRAVDTDPENAVLASPPPMSTPLPPPRLQTNPVPTPPISVASVSFTPQELSALLTRAKSELPLRAVRFPVLGEYQDAFTGEEFTSWLRLHVKELEGDLDRAEELAKELTEKLGLLRRLGELGNGYEDTDDAFYQFRPKAFNLEVPKPKDEKAISPLEKSLSPLAENVAKRTATFAGLVTKALNTNPTGELPHVRGRREADAADKEYRVAVRKLDRQRLGLEERIEDTLKTLQKWELERLRAVKTVLAQYHTCLERLYHANNPSLERSSTLIASYQPESDLKGLIEQYRTGPFRPSPHVYESLEHDESDVVFGIDLRKWSEAGMWNPTSATSPDDRKDMIPPVLTALLSALTEAYNKLPTDSERRKTWIYEVPLVAVHHLRETLNAVPPMQDIPDDVLAKYDAPVLASAVKLWALELDPPLLMFESWDEIRKLYPSVGALKPEEQRSEERHLQDLQVALQKIPRVHLIVLDTIVKHVKDLVDNTKEEDEANDVYVSKLALSLGRAILRPKVETKFSIQDRHPTLLFIDLVTSYAEILPPTIVKKKRESERKVPVRKHTRPTDMRMSRSRISAGADLRELQAQQLAQRGLKAAPKSPPPVPPVPTIVRQSPSLENVTPTEAQSHEVSTQDSSTLITEEPEAIVHSPTPTEISLKDERTPTASGFSNVPPPPPLQSQQASLDNIPPPPPLNSQKANYSSIPPPPPLSNPPESASVTPKPTDTESRLMFKEPPPEDDDLPPRPQFKEPPPERADSPPLPMPKFADPLPSPPFPMPSFADPPPEPASPSATSPSVGSPAAVSPSAASPVHAATSYPTSPRSGSASSRDASPSKGSLSRRSSLTPGTSHAGTGIRGPRTSSRTPRGGGGASVSSMVSNFNNRSSLSGSSLARPASPASASGRSPSRPMSGSHVKRSSAARVPTFERRTMASDAEDEIIQ